MYGKIFDSIYEGTLYGQWEAIVTFQQLIVLCDADGTIDMTPPAIAARTSIPLEIITKGLQILQEPDPYSRTPGSEGRRIELIDSHRPWGWVIVNHEKYKMMVDAGTVRSQNRERQRKHREQNKKLVTERNAPSRSVTDVTESNAPSRYTDTDTDTDTKTTPVKPDAGPPAEPPRDPPQMTAAGQLAVSLRLKGIAINSTHPTLLAWIEGGFTLPAILEAVEIARIQKPTGSIAPNYLDAIVRSPPKKPVDRWWDDRQKTMDMARKFGVPTIGKEAHQLQNEIKAAMRREHAN